MDFNEDLYNEQAVIEMDDGMCSWFKSQAIEEYFIFVLISIGKLCLRKAKVQLNFVSYVGDDELYSTKASEVIDIEEPSLSANNDVSQVTMIEEQSFTGRL